MQAEEQLVMIKKGVQEIISEADLLKKLENSIATKTPLIIKLGLDPSAPDIHLGHAVVLRKMKQLQDLGHHVVLIIGDFTGQIGDPTGKAQGRQQLSAQQVQANAETYVTQLTKILDSQKTSVRFNSEWLTKMNFAEVLRLASSTTISRMLERDDFQTRYRNQVPIGLHEFFYPLMQAQDSVAISADIELGGTDQTFNILMGRQLQQQQNLAKQVAIFMPLLEGLDGIHKMSKSLNNYIGVNEAPPIMFKKVMEVPDKLIIKYFELATDLHPQQINELSQRLAAGENPRDIKLELALEITTLYHGSPLAEAAAQEFKKVFKQGAMPEAMPLIELQQATTLENLLPLLIEKKIIASKSAFRRLLQQKGVHLNQHLLELEDLSLTITSGDILKIGKKNFYRFD
ncbi:tyrosine--tRNA ligase [Enterococcus sp. HY326]|uniref:tyrosine--tRNA ligase n=1 Tax=Enterococcus sp. HY326 TaxID=2971265 RepID=UPI00223F378D|nr:tyrosine--tRNA ligase [Enterococcus sp. HY326]